MNAGEHVVTTLVLVFLAATSRPATAPSSQPASRPEDASLLYVYVSPYSPRYHAWDCKLIQGAEVKRVLLSEAMKTKVACPACAGGSREPPPNANYRIRGAKTVEELESELAREKGKLRTLQSSQAGEVNDAGSLLFWEMSKHGLGPWSKRRQSRLSIQIQQQQTKVKQLEFQLSKAREREENKGTEKRTEYQLRVSP